ncbi:low-density lipoprotein receptor-related protein 1-like [Dreissena polymorpha]|uniref:low-density lipoprotein receptor-related protein 1-like n=1 Tax=Dreissena polymorpha TaxID=45954 RepID=UPI0022645B55|nr:low-density lipoprotein receptor-related protein 1-like [Dreissena polymorpha]
MRKLQVMRMFKNQMTSMMKKIEKVFLHLAQNLLCLGFNLNMNDDQFSGSYPLCCPQLFILTVADAPGGLAQATCQCPKNHVPVGKNSCKPSCDDHVPLYDGPVQVCSRQVYQQFQAKEECLSTQYCCNLTGNCIPYLWQCNGDYDCAQQEDVKDCNKRACKENYKKCNKTNKCIPEAWFCDGENDCGEGDTSDEGELCHEKTCGPENLRCNNGHCIPRPWQCDGDHDCSDRSGEKNCRVKNCTEGEFSCKDGNRCIPIFAQCDGKSDCSDYSDEENCTNNANCSQDQFMCKGSGLCIPHSWRRDGEKDCADGSDEKSCERQGTFVDV